ncbi:ABC transporter permease [Actinomadura rugatobispora]|uniref:ABC transporter permease n=1 Tax=Actinomadura rugatobispora TaxID=1994 RepID=A0ABW1A665_9ACTN|nr:ABC transporter permease [Actinomadura rugatobispora]
MNLLTGMPRDAATLRSAGPVRPGNLLRIARLDATLLWRNRTALFTVIGMPLLFAGLLLPARGQDIGGIDGAVFQGTGHLGFFLILVVFMHLTSVFTARREDLTLKRLRGTALSDVEILGGSVLTAAGMYLVQAVLLLALLVTALDGAFPADPLLLLAGLAAGAVIFALLAFAVSGLTPTAELAQLTVLPVLFGCMAGAGVMVPLDDAPEAVLEACRLLPLTPVVEIVRTAYFGQDFTVYGAAHPDLGFAEAWRACLRPFAILLAWAAIGRMLAARWFRWEPRHS